MQYTLLIIGCADLPSCGRFQWHPSLRPFVFLFEDIHHHTTNGLFSVEAVWVGVRAMSASSASLPEAYDLRVACSADDFASFARLACDYHDWLGLDLRFQNFEQEVASLPGCYAAPTGCILLISHTESTAEGVASPSPSVSTQDVACVAIRPLSQHHGAHSFDHITAAADSAAVANQSATEAAGTPNNTQQSAQPDRHRTVVSSPPNHHTCELKRLWVSQQHQKQGLGRALTVAALQAAEGMGYETMFLDTLESLASANRLYEGLGFRRRKPYYYNPLAGVVYWEKEL